MCRKALNRKLSHLGKGQEEGFVVHVSCEDQSLPPPVRHSEGLQGPRTSSSSQSKTPEASPWNPQLRLHVRPASGRETED